ncbi:MAG: hypothetical protein EHM57_07525 [Actinobacteria bacterium]|nr:MAG: hypothetical protein EHM57_07525 [Actinomycetota bacterium]
MADIHFTDDPAANRLLAADPFALLVGMVLYQQVPVEKAFAGPYVLQERLGGELDPAAIAAMDPAHLESVFKERPALHRFPANMAKRTQAVARHLVEEYGGSAAALWGDAPDAATLLARLQAMPGFGEYKARVTLGVLVNHYGIRPPGYEELVPNWPSIADVEAPEDLAELKMRKRAWKESGGG